MNGQIIGINMPQTMAKELKKRAAAINLSTANYCKIILQQWFESGEDLTMSEDE